GFPLDYGANVLPAPNREKWVAVGLGGFVILQSLCSRRPHIGLCGAIVAALAPTVLGLEPSFHLGVQIGATFLLVHSLGWPDRGPNDAPAILRRMAAALWIMHSVAYTYVDSSQSLWIVSAAAFLVLGVSIGARLISGTWTTFVLPVSASISLFAAPANYL